MKTKRFRFSAILPLAAAVLMFASCGKDNGPDGPDNPDAVKVTGVTLNKTATTIAVGGTETLTPTVAPANADNKNVTWSSDKTAVATVDNAGKVTGVSAGTATITVKTTDGSKTATCAVTVSATTVSVTGVTLNKSTTTIEVGGTETLTPTVAPAGATNQNVTWSSDNTDIATVDASGKVTGVSAGTATITVTTEDGSKTATCAVTVSATTVAVTGVSLNKAETTIAVDAFEVLTPTITPEGATNQNVTWGSDKTDIATVDASGKVTGVSAGTATITVTTEDGGKTATCAVTVTAAPGGKTVSVGEQVGTLTEGNNSGFVTFPVTVTGISDGRYDLYHGAEGDISNLPTGIVLGNNWEIEISGGTGTLYMNPHGGGHTAGTYDLQLTIYGTTSAPFTLTIKLGSALINGVEWATRNVDAAGTFAAAPEEYGMFYKWNDRTAWPSTGNVSWNSTSYPAAGWAEINDPCPEGWQVPTKAEQAVLLDTEKVTRVWTTRNGVNGARFTDKTSGASVFLPGAGYRYHSDGKIEGQGNNGLYWSATFDADIYAWHMIFNSSGGGGQYGNNSGTATYIHVAKSVRCVKK